MITVPDTVNDNEYDDASFTEAANEAHEALLGLWEAGASMDDISAVIKNALEQMS